jgi:N-acyl-phosphatidylethanolamine-hydrolysing phospholipase D
VRLVAPPITIEELPRIDAVLLSHDHYDHLDDATVRALSARFGAGLQWFAPLGYETWLRARGAQHIRELDWWEETFIDDTRRLRITATPAQHWTRRIGSAFNARLWCSWALHHVAAGAFYFAGDSGYCPAFGEIARLGPFRALAVPIGAYEPRWFMRAAHMNPEEAVQTYIDLGSQGRFCGMHWGTFRLTDEPPLEPPQRARAAWDAANLPPQDFSASRHGETIILAERDSATGPG